MQPAVVFLGTGQGPEAVAKQLRGSGGIIVKSGDNQLHIDPGPGSLRMARMYNIGPRETTCVLASHYHLGHCNDINACIHSLSYGGLDKRGVLIAESQLINGSEEVRPYLTEFHKGCLEKYMVLRPGQKAGIDDIEIKATVTKHNADCIGFQIMAPEFTLSYLSDTGYIPELLEEHEGADVLILNTVNPFTVNTENNLNSEAAVKLISHLKPKLSVLTHFSIKMLQADPIVEAREVSRQTGHQIIAASDGLSLNPATYSTKRRQTL